MLDRKDLRGQRGKLLVVNRKEDGVEFIVPPTSGDVRSFGGLPGEIVILREGKIIEGSGFKLEQFAKKTDLPGPPPDPLIKIGPLLDQKADVAHTHSSNHLIGAIPVNLVTAAAVTQHQDKLKITTAQLIDLKELNEELEQDISNNTSMIVNVAQELDKLATTVKNRFAVSTDWHIDMVKSFDELLRRVEMLEQSMRDHSHDVDHDTTSNYKDSKHIDHKSIRVKAGSGLSGGGYIDSDIDLELGIDHLEEVTTLNGVKDYLVVWSAESGKHKKIKINNLGGK